MYESLPLMVPSRVVWKAFDGLGHAEVDEAARLRRLRTRMFDGADVAVDAMPSRFPRSSQASCAACRSAKGTYDDGTGKPR